jgi:nicotinamidase-related amidase
MGSKCAGVGNAGRDKWKQRFSMGKQRIYAISGDGGGVAMGAPRKPFRWKRVLVDVCTQHDYLDPQAILQVANQETLLANLKGVFHWVREWDVAVVSLVESHRPSEPANGFPLHCIDGTRGQEKLPFTIVRPSVVVENDNYLSLPPDLKKKHRQLIFRKRNRDILSNPKADRFLTTHLADEFIIVGVGLERSIRSLALGLLSRHKPVTVVSDACGYWSGGDGDLALLQLGAKGIRLVTTAELVAPPTPASTVRHRGVVGRRFRDRHHPTASRPARIPSVRRTADE